MSDVSISLILLLACHFWEKTCWDISGSDTSLSLINHIYPWKIHRKYLVDGRIIILNHLGTLSAAATWPSGKAHGFVSFFFRFGRRELWLHRYPTGIHRSKRLFEKKPSLLPREGGLATDKASSKDLLLKIAQRWQLIKLHFNLFVDTFFFKWIRENPPPKKKKQFETKSKTRVNSEFYYTWIFQICKICACSPKKPTKKGRNVTWHIWKIQV